MNYFDIIDKLKQHFESDELVSTVSQGDIFDIDLNKQTLFPLVHLIVNTATFEENVIRYNISILAMDIVNVSKDETTDKFSGNNNELYVLNTMLAVHNRCYELLRRGTLYTEGFQVDGTPTCEPFTERMENNLTGWTLTVDILIPNDMTIC
tara:strand:+ start:3730 stop:4182 length:453 start_codon:yes stop_codon:yes gene_type:complete